MAHKHSGIGEVAGIVIPHPTQTWIVTAVILITLSGCGPKEAEITLGTIDADKLLYARGTAALEEGDWVRAREYFVEIRDNYPQSPLRADARLGVGDSFLGQGQIEGYFSAKAEFEEFLSLFPTNPRMDYARFKLGMVHFKQMRGPELDQSSTREAIREFEDLIQRHPDSESRKPSPRVPPSSPGPRVRVRVSRRNLLLPTKMVARCNRAVPLYTRHGPGVFWSGQTVLLPGLRTATGRRGSWASRRIGPPRCRTIPVESCSRSAHTSTG